VGEELAAGLDRTQDGSTYPFGAHVSVVEVDTETGRVTPRRHVAVDDCGRILNPLLVEGQQHGGLAQGIAQALFEEVVFDSDGQPLTATLADYRMPSART
jgi:aerobic carbon-monoxide dehydrogenase large subunit